MALARAAFAASPFDLSAIMAAAIAAATFCFDSGFSVFMNCLAAPAASGVYAYAGAVGAVFGAAAAFCAARRAACCSWHFWVIVFCASTSRLR